MGAHEHADYTPGSMPITDQKQTFSGFMLVTQWASVLIGMLVLFLVMVFSVGAPWVAALFGVAALGLLAGLVMRMGGAWYATVIGSAIAALLIGGIVSLIANLA